MLVRMTYLTNTNYLKNVKNIVKLVKENCKDTKLSFSSVICHTDVKDIAENKTTKLLQTAKHRVY